MRASEQACCTGLYELPLTRYLLGSSFHPGGIALTERLARATALGPTDRVLDLAAGRGETALHLARNYGCHVTALDLSELQAHEIELRAKADGLADRVKVLTGDATCLPVDDGCFDVVLCECALCTFHDQTAALTEVKRVLRPRGVFGLSDVTLNRNVPPELDSLLGRILCIAGALPLLGYVEALESAGFSKVRTRDESQVLVDLVQQIESRLTRLGSERVPSAEPDALSEGVALENSIAPGLDLEEAGATLRVARAFIQQKGLGYAIVTARLA